MSEVNKGIYKPLSPRMDSYPNLQSEVLSHPKVDVHARIGQTLRIFSLPLSARKNLEHNQNSKLLS